MKSQAKRNHSSKKYSIEPGERFVRILAIYLRDNCSRYRWGSEAEGHLRARRWDLLYSHAERLTVVRYESAREHFLANQLAALILKLPFSSKVFGFEKTARETAIEKFHNAEKRCERTNRRFLSLRRGRKTRFSAILESARRSIERVLGEEVPLSEILDLCAFGPGACIGVHGNATSLVRKFYASEWSVSPTCAPYFSLAIKRNFSFFTELCEAHRSTKVFDRDVVDKKIKERLKYVPYNKVDFVPKTAKTERSIAVEPLGNTFVQRGIDLVMRSRLLGVGIDLSDQGRNAHLAKVGSVTGTLSTLDLSSASDTVATELVRYLLPLDWFLLLNNCRSPAWIWRREITSYNKFTSMGNGFCFPLETLIFWALCRAVVDSLGGGIVSVYGDDIIVPTHCFSSVVEVLQFSGFVLNIGKSFADGPFRESCGADWYEGTDVRPVYLDSHLASDSDLMCFHNATLRSEWVREAFSSVRPYLRELVPEDRRYLRPEGRRYRSETGSNRIVDPITVKNLNGAFDVPLDEFMSSRWASWNREQMRWSWKEWVYSPLPDDRIMADFKVGRYWMFLQGSPGGVIPLRRETRRRSVVK